MRAILRETCKTGVNTELIGSDILNEKTVTESVSGTVFSFSGIFHSTAFCTIYLEKLKKVSHF
jgi:hypothetical protein